MALVSDLIILAQVQMQCSIYYGIAIPDLIVLAWELTLMILAW